MDRPLGRGRGMALTKPAWMTSGIGQTGPESPSQSPSQSPSLTNGGGAAAPAPVIPAATQGHASVASPQQRPVPIAAPARVDPAVESRADWAEYTTNEGRKYYHNHVTGQTVWEKPAILKTEAEKLLDACPWKEYFDDKGRAYYYNENTKLSEWTMPVEFRDWKDRLARLQHGAPLSLPSSSSAPPQPAASTPVQAAPVLAKPQPVVVTPQIKVYKPSDYSKEEAREIFWELLREKGVTNAVNWEECMRIIMTDPRYAVLETTTLRKQAFFLFCEHYVKEQEDLKLKKAEESKQRFQELVSQEIEARIADAPRDEKLLAICKIEWRSFADKYGRDERFLAVSDEIERELIFDQHVNRLMEAEREAKNNTRSKHVELLTKFFSTETSIDLKSQWRVIRDRIERLIVIIDAGLKVDAGDEQDAALRNNLTPEREQWLLSWKELSDLDRLNAFETHMRALDRKYLNDVQIKKTELAKKARLAREAFRKLLFEMFDRGDFSINTKWKVVAALIADHQAFKDMYDVEGSTPGEIFGDFIEEKKENYRPYRRQLKGILKDVKFKITPETPFQDMREALNDHPLVSSVPELYLKFYFDETLEAEIQKQKDAEHKHKRAIEKFTKLLHDYDLHGDSKWENIEKKVKDRSASRQLSTSEQITIFQQHILGRPPKPLDATEKAPVPMDDEEDEEGLIKDDDDDDDDDDAEATKSSTKDKSDRKKHRSKSRSKSRESRKKHRHRSSRHKKKSHRSKSRSRSSGRSRSRSSSRSSSSSRSPSSDRHSKSRRSSHSSKHHKRKRSPSHSRSRSRSPDKKRHRR